MRSPLSLIAPPLLSWIARATRALPRNELLWSRTFRGKDGDAYLTRILGPRARGWRPVAHQIWRPDADRDPHNHPWREARFIVVSGDYTEERRLPSGVYETRRLEVGDVNVFTRKDYHRLIAVSPGTCTLGLISDICQDWGFWVEGKGFVPEAIYQATWKAAP